MYLRIDLFKTKYWASYKKHRTAQGLNKEDKLQGLNKEDKLHSQIVPESVKAMLLISPHSQVQMYHRRGSFALVHLRRPMTIYDSHDPLEV